MIINVLEGDVFEKTVDVLVLKFAGRHHGVDLAVSQTLGRSLAVPNGGHQFFATSGAMKSREILVLGVGPLHSFEYQEIYDFARRSMSLVLSERPEARRIGITVHGPGYGLDELASVDALLSGLHSAINEQVQSSRLQNLRVSIIELNRRRANKLREYLAAKVPQRQFHAPQDAEAFNAATASEITNDRTYSKRLFAAMPFSDDYVDQWELAMQPAAHENKLIIERLDHEHFTGDIVNEIRNRIERSSAVVALLDTHNPNVFLEVGYAWGIRKPTVLLLHESQEPPFDVKNQRLIRYTSLTKLKQALTGELKGLLANRAF